ncbi:MAG: hypothetical protein J6W82_05095 [Bacteroidales bacterium]|nr:hypothetical protein [Bacteroidales bacterium]
MTITELINHVDNISPNQYTDGQKTAWLSNFDGKVFREVIQTHEPTLPDLFGAYDDGDAELLIEEPYALDVYSNYLLAKIAEANAEIPKYNLYSVLFNTEYSSWVSWYHRTHRPKREPAWRY